MCIPLREALRYMHIGDRLTGAYMIISDEIADAFAHALIVHSGHRTKAAEACGYERGIPARSAGSDLARNPKVLERLQPLLSQHLQSLTPKAIVTLGKLLDHKSGYIRLEAAKDILDRNGVGTAGTPVAAQPFLIRINLGSAPSASAQQPVLEHEALPHQEGGHRPGGRKSEKAEVTSSPAHNFSPEVISPGGTIDSGAVKPLVDERPIPVTYSWDLD